MGQCFLYGNSGGGTRSYKVTGSVSAPENPFYGDIWVQTSVAITQIDITSEQQVIPVWDGRDGMIQIVTGTQCIDDLYVDSDHRREYNLYLYPRACVQRFNGAWHWVTAYIYTFKNRWIQFSSVWNGELFDNGNQYEGITGGWTLSKFSLKDGAFDTGLTSETSGNDVMACTVNKIDVGQFSTLHIQCYSNFRNSGGPGNSRFGICSTNGPSYDNFAAYKDISTGSNNISYYSIDISSVTGTYYVKFYASVEYMMGWLKIEKMWLT